MRHVDTLPQFHASFTLAYAASVVFHLQTGANGDHFVFQFFDYMMPMIAGLNIVLYGILRSFWIVDGRKQAALAAPFVVGMALWARAMWQHFDFGWHMRVVAVVFGLGQAFLWRLLLLEWHPHHKWFALASTCVIVGSPLEYVGLPSRYQLLFGGHVDAHALWHLWGSFIAYFFSCGQLRASVLSRGACADTYSAIRVRLGHWPSLLRRPAGADSSRTRLLRSG